MAVLIGVSGRSR